jgi:hypothetical protein
MPLTLTFPQMRRGASSKKAPPQRDPKSKRERIMAAAQRQFAALLRTIGTWLLLIGRCY